MSRLQPVQLLYDILCVWNTQVEWVYDAINFYCHSICLHDILFCIIPCISSVVCNWQKVFQTLNRTIKVNWHHVEWYRTLGLFFNDIKVQQYTMNIYVTKWCIEGHMTGAWWDLCDRPICWHNIHYVCIYHRHFVILWITVADFHQFYVNHIY